jgi:hypothetical protein
MLWLQPARDWFDGIAPRRPEARPAPAPVQTPVRTQVAPVGPPVPAVAPAATGRPAAVLWAGILTWIGSGLTLAGAVVSGVLLGMDTELLLDEVHRQNPELKSQGVSDDLLVGVSFAMLAGFALWCVAAAVLAFLVLRGVEWARVALIVSAATAAAVFLLCCLLGAFLLAITLVAAVGVVVLLVRPETKAWFASRRGPRPPAGAVPPR